MGIAEVQMYCPECRRNVLGHKLTTDNLSHFVITLMTCGMWFPCWLIASAIDTNRPYRCPVCGTAGPKDSRVALFVLIAAVSAVFLIVVGSYVTAIHAGPPSR